MTEQFRFPIPGQLCLPAPPVLLLLMAPKDIPAKPKRSRRKVILEKQEPEKFNGKIRLYWQEFGEKPDRILEVHDYETYAALEILHGLYHLEGFERWQEHPGFDGFRDDIFNKCEIYVNKLKRLYRLSEDKWDWDWAK